MIDVKIEGLKKYAKSLDKRIAGDVKAFQDEIAEAAFKTQELAVKSIQKQSMGAQYGKHIASKPGEAPNTDTGRLVQSIKIDDSKIKQFQMRVGTNLKYGAFLEFGTTHIKKRPWLRPAFKIAIKGFGGKLRQRLRDYRK